MGLAVICNDKMRLKIGDVYVYTKGNTRLLIEAPYSVTIKREYLLSNQGESDDRRKQIWSEKRPEKKSKNA